MINSMRLLTDELEKMALRPVYVPVNEKKRVKIFGVELAYLYLFGIGTAFVGGLRKIWQGCLRRGYGTAVFTFCRLFRRMR